MQPPRLSRILPKSDTPQWFQDLLTPLNQFLGDTVQALAGNLTRRDNFLSTTKTSAFTSAASGNTSVKVMHGLPNNPTAAYVFQIAPVSASVYGTWTSAWSFVWRLTANNTVEFLFQGLPASTQFTATFGFE